MDALRIIYIPNQSRSTTLLTVIICDFYTASIFPDAYVISNKVEQSNKNK